MATFLLVAGAYHGSWCFERILPLLKAQGHHVLSPDLPGMGEDDAPFSALEFIDWVQFVADLASRQEEPVILLGHSRAGTVIGQVAEARPDAVRALVYLAAVMPMNGETMGEGAARTGTLNPAIAKAHVSSADGLSYGLLPGIAAKILYQLCDPADIDAAEARICNEPVFAGKHRMSLSDARYGSVPRIYIETLQDIGLPILQQRAMQASLPCEKVYAIDTDHSPFYSAPEKLVQILDEIAATA